MSLTTTHCVLALYSSIFLTEMKQSLHHILPLGLHQVHKKSLEFLVCQCILDKAIDATLHELFRLCEENRAATKLDHKYASQESTQVARYVLIIGFINHEGCNNASTSTAIATTDQL